jgi:hypothetical protein
LSLCTYQKKLYNYTDKCQSKILNYIHIKNKIRLKKKGGGDYCFQTVCWQTIVLSNFLQGYITQIRCLFFHCSCNCYTILPCPFIGEITLMKTYKIRIKSGTYANNRFMGFHFFTNKVFFCSEFHIKMNSGNLWVKQTFK